MIIMKICSFTVLWYYDNIRYYQDVHNYFLLHPMTFKFYYLIFILFLFFFAIRLFALTFYNFYFHLPFQCFLLCYFKCNLFQKILIEDICVSFVLSLVYAFGFSILPVPFRILSLKYQEKKRVLLYKFSKILSLI
jgi:hypothetical protein